MECTPAKNLWSQSTATSTACSDLLKLWTLPVSYKKLHDARPVCALDLSTTQNLNTLHISFIVVKRLYTHKTMVQQKYNLNHNRWAEIG